MDFFIEQLREGEAEAWLLLFLLYSLAASAFGCIYCVRINNWPSVFGDMEQFEPGRLSPSMRISDQNYSADVRYLYEVDGNEYTGSRLSPFQMVVSHNLRFFLRLQMSYVETREDGKVRVYYNPRWPQKSYLVPPGFIGYAFILAFMLIPLSLYLYVAIS